MLAESLRLHAELLAQWSTLRQTYLDARERITSFEAWEKTFADNPPAEPSVGSSSANGSSANSSSAAR
jgi:galactofuranosylgalactofuranosylrhamnosyl-N-acetylglucosaminyl-diphospho-decaprenol beta-1,5/1,6-galactofuranosyltransferase